MKAPDHLPMAHRQHTGSHFGGIVLRGICGPRTTRGSDLFQPVPAVPSFARGPPDEARRTVPSDPAGIAIVIAMFVHQLSEERGFHPNDERIICPGRSTRGSIRPSPDDDMPSDCVRGPSASETVPTCTERRHQKSTEHRRATSSVPDDGVLRLSAPRAVEAGNESRINSRTPCSF